MQLSKNKSFTGSSSVIGILLLLSLLIPILNWMLILSQFTPEDGNASLIILNNEFLFRLSVIIGLVNTIIITLAFRLYKIFGVINRNMASSAFFLKLFEAALTASLSFAHFIALLVLKGEPQNVEMQNVVNLLVKNYITFTTIPGVFFGISMTIFLYLFLKSGYVPYKFALVGTLSYSLVVVYDSITILLPDYSAMLPIQIIGSVPVFLFQIIFGFWLLFRSTKRTSGRTISSIHVIN